MNVTKMICGTVVMAAAAAVGETLEVGTGATRELSVPEDLVQADDVTVATRGQLNKSGAGTWTLPVRKASQAGAMNLGVRSGTLVLKSSADDTPDAPDVAAILAKAALWLEADTNVVTNATGEVTRWLDCRETGDGSSENPYAYISGVADTTYGAYPSAQVQNGHATVYFNGYTSGSWMDLRNPDGTSATVADVQTLFLVECTYEKVGSFLGGRGGSGAHNDLQVNNKQVPTTPLWVYQFSEDRFAVAARTWLNGEEVDAIRSVGLPSGFALVDAAFLGDLPDVQCLMNDRDIGKGTASQRYGGDHLSAVVLFTHQITETERMRLERHFLRKYGLGASVSFAVKTAVGSRLSVDESADGAGRIDVSLSGSGELAYVSSADRTLGLRDTSAEILGFVDYGTGTISAQYAPELAVSAGQSVAVTGPDANLMGVNTYVRTAGEAQTVTKTGTGELTVREVKGDVRRFDVMAGKVNFSAKLQPVTDVLSSETPVTGTVQNPSVEDGMAELDAQTIVNWEDGKSAATSPETGVFENWHGLVATGCRGRVVVVNTAFSSSYTTSWQLPTNAVDGTCYIFAKRDADIWTTFTVPKTAYYKLRFHVAARKGYASQQIAVKFGVSEETLETAGYFTVPSTGYVFEEKEFYLGELAADVQQQLWFVAAHTDKDGCVVYDSFEILETEKRSDSVPNGDFERTASDFTDSNDASPASMTEASLNTGKVTGWRVIQAPEKGADKVLSGFTTPRFYYGFMYNVPWADHGNVACYLSSSNAAVETTFTPKAGTWHLAARMAISSQSSDKSASTVQLSAEWIVGNVTQSLGSVSFKDYRFPLRNWPMPLSSDGVTAGTLRIVLGVPDNGGGRDPHAILDDVQLLAADELIAGEMIVNGSFESDSTWTYVHDDPDGKGYKTVRGTSGSSVSGLTDYGINSWGCNRGYGDCVLLIRRRGAVVQPVSMAPGLYRARLVAQQRTWRGGSLSSYVEPIRVCLAKNGVTNECLRFTAGVTNFTEYAAIFPVREGGTYDFIVQGCKGDGDECMFVDGVSLQRIVPAAETPDLPRAMTLNVAQGATVNLDFTGTNRIDRVRLGGRTRTGVISAETYPEYVTGMGALFTEPHGTLILVR